MKLLNLFIVVLLGITTAIFYMKQQDTQVADSSPLVNAQGKVADQTPINISQALQEEVPAVDKLSTDVKQSNSDSDEMHRIQIAHTHKSINGFTLIGTAVLNTEHYLEIMEKLAAAKTNFSYLSSHYWVEYWGEDEDGRILFKLYDLMGFSDTQTEKSELAFQYELDNLYGSENYGDSSPENESTVMNALNDLGIESPLSLSCAQMRCMFSVEWLASYDFDISKIDSDIAAEIETNTTDCTVSRFNGFSNRQYVTITCKDK